MAIKNNTVLHVCIHCVLSGWKRNKCDVFSLEFHLMSLLKQFGFFFLDSPLLFVTQTRCGASAHAPNDGGFAHAPYNKSHVGLKICYYYIYNYNII